MTIIYLRIMLALAIACGVWQAWAEYKEAWRRQHSLATKLVSALLGFMQGALTCCVGGFVLLAVLRGIVFIATGG